MEHYDCIIVGGGHAGAQAAHALRQHGYAGSIALIGDEPVLPYDRPSLSKEYLAGKKPFERMRLRPETFWSEREIALHLGRRVVSLDAAAHRLDCDDGSRFAYGSLIWAAGGAPRRLTCPGHDLKAVHYLRNKADCDRLIAALPDCRRVVIVGGGYIGLEAAAVLRELGKAVTLVEAQDRVLARVAAEPISRFYEAEHRAKGVEILLGTGVEAIVEGADGGCAVRLSGGRERAADLVLAGIGIEPEVGPLAAAGAETQGGALVDGLCRTTLRGCLLHRRRRRSARRPGHPDRIRAERQRSGDRRRQGAVRLARPLRGHAVVLVEPVRSEAADGRVSVSDTTRPCCAAIRRAGASA